MPTLTEIDPIAKTLGNLLAGEPVTHGPFTMIPVLAPLVAEPAWLTLAEAGKRVRITEVSKAGSVPDLHVTNTADQPRLPRHAHLPAWRGVRRGPGGMRPWMACPRGSRIPGGPRTH